MNDANDVRQELTPAQQARAFYKRYFFKSIIRTIIWVLSVSILVCFFPNWFWLWYVVAIFIFISIIVTLFAFLATTKLEQDEKQSVDTE
ncbi:MAG: hypothetical protein J0M03_12340 [Acidobacteria bacterium]|nr:hypothetical protein [Acidobacteriota bacterium]